MEQLHIDSFTVVGLTARTSNAKEASGNGVIGGLWARFRKDGLLDRIKHRADSHIVAVYSEYESDKDGEYTYTLGSKVTSAKDVPAEMVARRTDSGEYGIFTAQGGPAIQLVMGLWQRIWSLEKSPRLRRAYRTDFEIYLNPDAEDAGQKVDVYIGLKRP
ncbi:MAG TPA: GyrI-like domain-containing protein [Bryobacteraceae bacterium]|nr:GyrI-like domain-containing protein [Bryobacteraceae bacterium]